MLQKRPPHLQVKPVSPSFLLQTIQRLFLGLGSEWRSVEGGELEAAPGVAHRAATDRVDDVSGT